MIILVYILYSLVLVISLVLFFNVFKKNSQDEQEIQIDSIITCMDGVKFSIVKIEQKDEYRIIALKLLNKEIKAPCYKILESEIEQFINFRYSCKNMDNNSSIEIGKLPFDFMRYYELDIIIKIFKERYNFRKQLYEAMENMTFSSFDMIYKDLVFRKKGN